MNNQKDKPADEPIEPVTVVVLDGDFARRALMLDGDSSLTLIAVMSEDPSCWDEVVAYWPRYRTPPVCEFADSLSMDSVHRETALRSIEGTDVWVVIDLEHKRIVTGQAFMRVGRDQAFAMVVDEKGKQHCPLSVHLPPWWELTERVGPCGAYEPRKTILDIPRTNRQFLFGDALLEYLATGMLQVVESDRWTQGDAATDERARYPMTIEVHRDWLMTPRDELGGRTPRQLLHGAHDWIDRLVHSQRIRFEEGGPIVAAPDDVAGYEDAPMGSEEMVIYFDLCRELISAGWFFCSRDNDLAESRERTGPTKRMSPPSQDHFVDFLRDVKDDWLEKPLEGGSPPSFIIDCSRRRVPRGADVPIAGMDRVETGGHFADCDCPICEMMADGMFGVSFTSLDGHHLDLDDEFAFSTHETLEAWEEQQREWAEMSAAMDRKQAERDAAPESEPDEFASVWSSPMTDQPLPGDSQGHMKLAFLLAEIVTELEAAAAPRNDIKKLNSTFSAYRTTSSVDQPESAQHLAAHLESLTARYPNLIPRIADFQSHLDQNLRLSSYDDFPF